MEINQEEVIQEMTAIMELAYRGYTIMSEESGNPVGMTKTQFGSYFLDVMAVVEHLRAGNRSAK